MGLFDTIQEKANQVGDSINNFLTENGFDSALNALNGGQGSDWQGLSKHLIATFYPVRAENGQYFKEGSQIVVAPLLEGAEMEYTLNWQSPFEQMGTEAKAPALTAMLQSGVLSQAYASFMSTSLGQQAAELNSQNAQGIAQALESMEGRTGITKLNSIQTFSGMSPVKCTMKLLFRAYSDPKKEVEKPLQTLLEWATPKALSDTSSLVLIAKHAGNGSTNASDYISALLPSHSPTMIAMEYKGRKYSPMVIESISDPITSPTTSTGHYASAEVSLTISSVMAWDRNDIKNLFAGKKQK